MKAEQSSFSFTCRSIGNFHIPRILDQNRMIGKAVNAFDTTINVRTDTNELLVVTIGQVRSPVNFNVSPDSSAYSGNIYFKEILIENAEARIVVSNEVDEQERLELQICDLKFALSWHNVFQNSLYQASPESLETFAKNRDEVFSVLVAEAHAKFGCLLNPDITTRGLLLAFVDELIQNKGASSNHEFRENISRGLVELCGKGPGFTPAGDDFIAGYLAAFNWLAPTMELGDAIIPGNEFSILTTWTSFKLMEYGARKLLDEQMQEMINSIARQNTSEYIKTIKLISKRGHTSGIDFATGMTYALFTINDRLYGTRIMESIRT